ncbi:hypothetical protein M422DRAFT_34921 [Sphaerobolus stellatus SS14]|uniref:Uncharacterized protein n=1 Tax=Sphaerobolus stellatus (strain SS14) TaxID=990650 RepID=A0A0C9UIX5_SPHS4|nr:hypothetical protein M422DRAFT_34921 [Sphaerobolus stellatus SS14]
MFFEGAIQFVPPRPVPRVEGSRIPVAVKANGTAKSTLVVPQLARPTVSMETKGKEVVPDAMLRLALSVKQPNISDSVSTPFSTPVKACTRPLVFPATPKKAHSTGASIVPWVRKAEKGGLAIVETARRDTAPVPVPSPQTPQKARPLPVLLKDVIGSLTDLS